MMSNGESPFMMIENYLKCWFLKVCKSWIIMADDM